MPPNICHFAIQFCREGSNAKISSVRTCYVLHSLLTYYLSGPLSSLRKSFPFLLPSSEHLKFMADYLRNFNSPNHGSNLQHITHQAKTNLIKSVVTGEQTKLLRRRSNFVPRFICMVQLTSYHGTYYTLKVRGEDTYHAYSIFEKLYVF